MSRTLPPSSPTLEEILAETEEDGLLDLKLDLACFTAGSKKNDSTAARASSSTTTTTNSLAPMATKVTKVVHRNIKMKLDPSTSTTPTAILPSPASPSGSFIPLPLPAIVPLHHQTPPFVCPAHLSAASSTSSPLSTSTPSSPLSSSSSPQSPSRQAYLVPTALGNGSAGSSPVLMDPVLLHGHTLSRSASASPVPGSTSEQPKKNDSKKRPRSASTPSGSNEGSPSSARSKRKRKTPEQLALLEKEFETNPMPNKDVREHLSQNLGLTSRQVQIWFQNKRAKVKNNRVSAPGGTQSPEEASSPETSPSMHSPIRMESLSSSSSSSCSSSFSLPTTTDTSALSSSYPAPSSPSSTFQQFSNIDSFFEPSYFDLLLDAPSYSGGPDVHQQIA
jgi:hypothetical protein